MAILLKTSRTQVDRLGDLAGAHERYYAGQLAAGSGDLIAAMQASPCKEIALEPARDRMPVREVAF